MTPRPAPRRLLVGRIVRPHGIKGELVVEVLSDAPDRFARGARLGLGDPDAETVEVTVEAARPDRGRLLVRFTGIRDRTAAEGLRGGLLSIPTEAAARLPEGAYYPHQLEGLDVVDEGGRHVGVLAEVLSAPANDVWVVERDGRRVMLPAIAEVVVRVELDAKRIVVRPPEGLLE